MFRDSDGDVSLIGWGVIVFGFFFGYGLLAQALGVREDQASGFFGCYLVLVAVVVFVGWCMYQLDQQLGEAKPGRVGSPVHDIYSFSQNGSGVAFLKVIEQSFQQFRRDRSGRVGDDYRQYVDQGACEHPYVDYRLPVPGAFAMRFGSWTKRSKIFDEKAAEIEAFIVSQRKNLESSLSNNALQLGIGRFEFLLAQEQFPAATEVLDRLRRELPEQEAILAVHHKRLLETQTRALERRVDDL